MKLRSLHARLVAVAAIWTVGLIAAATIVAFIVTERYPHWGLIVHDGFLALTGAVLVTAGISVIRRGLSPFSLLRDRLAAIRDGRSARLEGDYPTEVAPLVDDLNTLLEQRERRVVRAVARAGDLAHGLKTPLAILAQESERADAAGHTDLAVSIRRQVDRMRRQIDWHLAQARVTAAGAEPAARTPVAEAASALARTLERLHAGRGLVITVSGGDGCQVRVPVEDFEEMVGNLLDNACKWAASRVTLTAVADPSTVIILVDDDGAGLHPSMREQVLQRGVRGDEAAPGSGLGLAIVRDLAEAYSGSIALEQSPDGGVRARLTLPASLPG